MNRLENQKRIPVSVIIPAYNEENGIAPQVNEISKVLNEAEIVYEIVVVDDGSGDRTAELAAETSARVLRHPENRGYGASLKSGIDAAKHDAIVIIDADGTYPADQIPNLIDKLEGADMVVGARIGDNVHIPLIRRPAKWILGWLAAQIAGYHIPDLNSGLRIFHRECAKQYYSVLPNNFSFTTTITLAMLGDDYRVVYHPIDYYRRIGKSKITARNFMDFIILVLRMAMLFQPLRVLLPIAFICVVLGGIKVGLDILGLFQRAGEFSWSIIYQPTLSTSAVLLLLVGLQLVLIGMVADGLLRRISQSSKVCTPSRRASTFEYCSDVESKDKDDSVV